MAEPPWPTLPGLGAGALGDDHEAGERLRQPDRELHDRLGLQVVLAARGEHGDVGRVAQDAHELEPGHAGVAGEKRDAAQPLEPVERRRGGREAVDARERCSG